MIPPPKCLALYVPIYCCIFLIFTHLPRQSTNPWGILTWHVCHTEVTPARPHCLIGRPALARFGQWHPLLKYSDKEASPCTVHIYIFTLLIYFVNLKKSTLHNPSSASLKRAGRASSEKRAIKFAGNVPWNFDEFLETWVFFSECLLKHAAIVAIFKRVQLEKKHHFSQIHFKPWSFNGGIPFKLQPKVSNRSSSDERRNLPPLQRFWFTLWLKWTGHEKVNSRSNLNLEKKTHIKPRNPKFSASNFKSKKKWRGETPSWWRFQWSFFTETTDLCPSIHASRMAVNPMATLMSA